MTDRHTDRITVAIPHYSASLGKMAEPIEMPFGNWTRVGQRKQVLGGVHTGATWRIPLNRPCAAAMFIFMCITKLQTDCCLQHQIAAFAPLTSTTRELAYGGA